MSEGGKRGYPLQVWLWQFGLNRASGSLNGAGFVDSVDRAHQTLTHQLWLDRVRLAGPRSLNSTLPTPLSKFAAV